MRQQGIVQPQGKPGEKKQEDPNLNAEQDVNNQEYAPHPDRHFLRSIDRLRPRCVVEICNNGFQSLAV